MIVPKALNKGYHNVLFHYEKGLLKICSSLITWAWSKQLTTRTFYNYKQKMFKYLKIMWFHSVWWRPCGCSHTWLFLFHPYVSGIGINILKSFSGKKSSCQSSLSFLMRNIDGGTLMQNPDVKDEDKLRNIVTYRASE